MASKYHSGRIHRRNFNDPGHAHALTFSCYHRLPFLSGERTCQWLASSIENARQRLQFDLWAWVFMPDHVHLIIHPRRPVYDIAAIRRHIKEPVARKAVAWLKEHDPRWLARVERQRGDPEGIPFLAVRGRIRQEYHEHQDAARHDRLHPRKPVSQTAC